MVERLWTNYQDSLPLLERGKLINQDYVVPVNDDFMANPNDTKTSTDYWNSSPSTLGFDPSISAIGLTCNAESNGAMATTFTVYQQNNNLIFEARVAVNEPTEPGATISFGFGLSANGDSISSGSEYTAASASGDHALFTWEIDAGPTYSFRAAAFGQATTYNSQIDGTSTYFDGNYRVYKIEVINGTGTNFYIDGTQVKTTGVYPNENTGFAGFGFENTDAVADWDAPASIDWVRVYYNQERDST